MAIQMKAAKQYFPVVLFIMLYVLACGCTRKSLTIQMKATEQYFPVARFACTGSLYYFLT